MLAVHWKIFTKLSRCFLFLLHLLHPQLTSNIFNLLCKSFKTLRSASITSHLLILIWSPWRFPWIYLNGDIVKGLLGVPIKASSWVLMWCVHIHAVRKCLIFALVINGALGWNVWTPRARVLQEKAPDLLIYLLLWFKIILKLEFW